MFKGFCQKIGFSLQRGFEVQSRAVGEVHSRLRVSQRMGWGHPCQGSRPPPPAAEGPVPGDHALCPSRSTCACVEYYGKALEALVKGTEVMCIHGKMKHKRDKIFTGFRGLQRWGASRGWVSSHRARLPDPVPQSPAGDASTACSPLRPSSHMPSVPTPLHVAAALLGFQLQQDGTRVSCAHPAPRFRPRAWPVGVVAAGERANRGVQLAGCRAGDCTAGDVGLGNHNSVLSVHLKDTSLFSLTMSIPALFRAVLGKAIQPLYQGWKISLIFLNTCEA